ncbi:transcriptional regulator with PAS, ATPase and Fis domain [Erwinia toletana]|uniref:Transcriptional regulator with PAS, ATPase and Fis domain n=1 Tax=Winslowiella toletana TaxID=92490 RepID=A0ABS4PCD5_9GAMM|nr:sigma 54-interacting transcriptional regulator [Winslowiella toletana]MBP2169588.1 transcriptional regulator with PAS, ATPase and Fis domain [Winslowiella toletana]
MVGLTKTQMRSSADEVSIDNSSVISTAANSCSPQADIHNHLHKIVQTIAPLKIDVLLQGETGTGKDTLAMRIYRLSGCRGPMVPVNCAAIPETLAESELFGVMSGAYTGANNSRAGYIESANKGLLFLDEIDSMPLTVQAKLLRVLETRAIERLGSTKSVGLDLRIVAASQTPLEQLVEQGRFRRDLFFRLDTIKIDTPTVRSRPELIIPMFRRFTHEAALRLDQPLPGRSPALDEALLLHSWPGNIREMKAAAERFVLGLPPLCSSELKKEEGRSLLKDRMRRIERSLIHDCLRRHDNRIDDVVHELGIPRRTLYHRLKLLNLDS